MGTTTTTTLAPPGCDPPTTTHHTIQCVARQPGCEAGSRRAKSFHLRRMVLGHVPRCVSDAYYSREEAVMGPSRHDNRAYTQSALHTFYPSVRGRPLLWRKRRHHPHHQRRLPAKMHRRWDMGRRHFEHYKRYRSLLCLDNTADAFKVAQRQ